MLCQHYCNYRIVSKTRIDRDRLRQSVASHGGRCSIPRGFMENTVALKYVFLHMLQFSPLNTIPPITRVLKSLHNDKIPPNLLRLTATWNKPKFQHPMAHYPVCLFYIPTSHQTHIMSTGIMERVKEGCAWPKLSLDKTQICFSTDCQVWICMQLLSLLQLLLFHFVLDA